MRLKEMTWKSPVMELAVQAFMRVCVGGISYIITFVQYYPSLSSACKVKKVSAEWTENYKTAGQTICDESQSCSHHLAILIKCMRDWGHLARSEGTYIPLTQAARVIHHPFMPFMALCPSSADIVCFEKFWGPWSKNQSVNCVPSLVWSLSWLNSPAR